jgi:hypothetical protein
LPRESAALAILAGGCLLLAAIWQWWLPDFVHLDYARTMRLVEPGAALIALGFQTVFSSFFVSIPGMRRNESVSADPKHAVIVAIALEKCEKPDQP